VRDTNLHATLEAFVGDCAALLSAETAGGAEIPFELIEQDAGRPGRTPLYCYRPLTDAFIGDRGELLSAVDTYAPAIRALEGLEDLSHYLRQRGESRVPAGERQAAEAAMRAFLGVVFDGRSEFRFDQERFEAAYQELEAAAYQGRGIITVIAPLLGVALDPETEELPLGEGLSLTRGDALTDAPSDAIWGEGEDPNVLAVLRVTLDHSGRPPLSLARSRFRRLLTALRLFEHGGYALDPVGWARVDCGAWRPVALGGSGRPRLQTSISAAHEDELRAFYNLVGRRPHSGELAWALTRFEMGCERLAPFEALTDYLLGLRALLEPEGPASGRLAQRLAAICAKPEDRAALAERTAHAISLERAVIAGLAPAEPGVDGLVDEIAQHLRALLRDTLCGHLSPDLQGLADRLLADVVVTA
jgi:hypothetical protein